MEDLIDVSRRRLLKTVTLSVAVIPVAAVTLRAASAADLPLLTDSDPTAKALNYVTDATKASGAKPGSKCANCTNYQGAAGSPQGGCLIFPGKAVKADGWCLSWTAKK